MKGFRKFILILNFLSLPKFYQRIKQLGINATFDDCRIFIEQQNVYQLTKQVRRPK